jgi:hypothetical protein
MSDSKEQQVKTVLSIINNMLDRNANVPDQATRTLLFLDKLFLVIDITLGSLTILNSDSSFSEATREQIKLTSDKIKNELSLSTDWILSPQYSPDHPFGNTEMKKAQRSFNTTAPYDKDTGK